MRPKNIEISLTSDLGQAEILYDLGKYMYRLMIDMIDVYNFYLPEYSYEYWKENYEKEEIKDFFKARFSELHENAEVLYV